MTKRVLIDAGNLRVGGGVQVAASFLDEVSTVLKDSTHRHRYPWLSNLTVEVTPTVLSNMVSSTDEWDLRVVDRTWRMSANSWSLQRDFDLEFNVFGPVYTAKRGHIRLAGFADGTSLYPRVGDRAPMAQPHWRKWLRTRVSRRFFERADAVVVEAEHVARDLVGMWSLGESKIFTVPNTVNGVFSRPDLWESALIPSSHSKARVCYITRAYPHKNLGMLGKVGRILEDVFGIETEFVLTLTQAEWEAQDPEVRRYSVNLGPVRITQAPDIYRQCDASIFPSLLESFSATPLESILLGCPLVASDRPYVREFVGSAAAYFDPLDSREASAVLADVLSSKDRRTELIAKGREQARTLIDSRKRAQMYLEVMDQLLAARRG